MSSFDVRDEQLEKLLNKLGAVIGGSLPPGIGFALTLFEFGDGESLFYISNAKRDTMIEALEELIGVLRSRADG